MTIVKIDDVLACGTCHTGAKYLADQYGVDWWDFLQNGIDASKLEHIDDINVKNAIAAAKQREMKEGK
jgi:hypothetical protein